MRKAECKVTGPKIRLASVLLVGALSGACASNEEHGVSIDGHEAEGVSFACARAIASAMLHEQAAEASQFNLGLDGESPEMGSREYCSKPGPWQRGLGPQLPICRVYCVDDWADGEIYLLFSAPHGVRTRPMVYRVSSKDFHVIQRQQPTGK